jgi:hypothetical protein
VLSGDRSGWREALAAMKSHLGLNAGHPLESRIHEIFLPVSQ